MWNKNMQNIELTWFQNLNEYLEQYDRLICSFIIDLKKVRIRDV